MLFRVVFVLVFIGFADQAWSIVEMFNKSLESGQGSEAKRGIVRIKDIVSFEGIRINILMGYGLVVGLDGTGDNIRNVVFAKKELESFLSKLGINANGAELKTKNVAAVMVTGNLPPFARSGNYIDVKVSALGDSKSLEGGMLLATPLKGADGAVYALAQGEISVQGLPPRQRGGQLLSQRGVRTSGQVANGATVEKEIDFDFSHLDKVNLSLMNSDISTAHRIADVINDNILQGIAKALDPHTVELSVPEDYLHDVLGMLAKIEQLEVVPDMEAKIIIDENTGTIVIGEKVKIRPVAISHGDLTLSIQDSIAMLDGNQDLKLLVASLNHLGLPQRDLIEILQVIKSAGALQGDLIVK